jgi:photosystem II stability/assembly factor-like uncharacterized protein
MKFSLFAAILVFFRLPGATRPEPIGPYGGSAAVVEVDPHRRGTVIAATADALLFRSTNNGDSWNHMPFPAELHASLHALVVGPGSGVYLAGLTDDSHQYSGIYQSGDGGRSWSRLQTLGRKEVWSIAVWPLDARVIAAGAEDGVFLSRDAGQSWRRISPESNRALRPVVSLAFDTMDSRTIYAGTPHLPWKTTDAGQTWESAHTGMPDDSDVFSIHVDETRPMRLFASACSGIYHSSNQGASWIKLVEPHDASFRTYQITQDPVNPEVLFAGTAHGLTRSTDRGKTWRKLSRYLTRWITFDRSRPGRIFVATDEAGILRSDNLGESLTPVNEGFCNRRVLSFAASETSLYASVGANASGGGIVRRTGPDRDWETLAATPQVLQIVSVDDKRLYALTPKSLLFSTDKGRNWVSVRLPSPIPTLTAVLTAADGTRLTLGTEDGIWYTDNGGKVWLAAGMPEGAASVRALVPLGPRSLAAVTNSGLLVSRDGFDYRAVSLSNVSGLIATDHDGWLAATGRGLSKSYNSGVSWQRVPGPLDGVTVSAICKHPTRRGVLFASRYGSVFGSEDDGRTWTPITSGEGSLQAVNDLVVTKGIPNAVFAITRNQGIYVIPIGSALTPWGGSSPNQSTRSTPVSGRLWPPY